MARGVRDQLILVVIALAVLGWNLGGSHLFDEDEPKNASCAAEMFARNDWVVPTFNQQLRTDKPVLLYWLQLSSYHLLGVSELSARVPSALMALLTILATYHIGRVLFRPEIGFWGALALLTSPMYVVVARASTPESTLVFLNTLALYVFAAGIRRPENSRDSGQLLTPDAPAGWLPDRWSVWIGLYVVLGFAVLAKGPIGVLLPLAALGLYACLQRAAITAEYAAPVKPTGQRTWLAWTAEQLSGFEPSNIWRAGWMMRPVLAIGLVLLVALPWYVQVAIQTDGAWVQGFLGKHNVGRFLEPLENHRGPIFYYILAIFAGMFPWSVFLPLALLGHTQRWRHGGALTIAERLLGCWALVIVAFYSLASTKLPHYVLPAYPAIALLIAKLVRDELGQAAITRTTWLRIAFGSVPVVGVGLGVGLVVAATVYFPTEQALGVIGLLLLIGGTAAWILAEYQQWNASRVTFAATAVGFVMLALGWGLARVDQYQNSPSLVTKVRQLGGDQVNFAGYRYLPPTIVYYARQRVENLQEPVDATHYFADHPHGYLLARTRDIEKLQAACPPGIGIVHREPRFLGRDEVLIFGPVPQTASRATNTKQ